MSGQIDIGHGGAIEVDTASLRDLARRLRVVRHHLDLACSSLRRAAWILRPGRDVGWEPPHGPDVGWQSMPALVPIAVALSALIERIERIAGGTERMCEVYELVELRVRQEAAGAGEAALALQERIARIEQADPTRAEMADWVIAKWHDERFEGLHEQAVQGAVGAGVLVGPGLLWMLPLFTTAVTGAGVQNGAVQAGAGLQGKAAPVTLTVTRRTERVTPPRSLADALAQIPDGAPQVRVDRYAMPDGTAEYVLYVVGTQSVVGGNPWDMASNMQMYLDETRSSSYQATVDALAASGAQPGDTVHAVGHSQGGMIASHLAMEGEYDVATLITAGSPVEPSVGDDTYVVQLRHTDDPVSALAGGGSAVGTGSADSVVVQREHGPAPSVDDLFLRAHHLGSYEGTAEMVDASADVRLQPLRELWQRLGSATSVTATEYRADRTE